MRYWGKIAPGSPTVPPTAPVSSEVEAKSEPADVGVVPGDSDVSVVAPSGVSSATAADSGVRVASPVARATDLGAAIDAVVLGTPPPLVITVVSTRSMTRIAARIRSDGIQDGRSGIRRDGDARSSGGAASHSCENGRGPCSLRAFNRSGIVS